MDFDKKILSVSRRDFIRTAGLSLAAMALTWLDDYTLTEPAEKS